MSDNSSCPLVFIVVLHFNNTGDTVNCVESCKKVAYENYRILITSNASSDKSASILRSAFPEIQLLVTGKNLGYAGGMNAGIRYAIENDAAYVWLLNNDTVVDSSCLDQMVQSAEIDKSIGMVGSKIYYFDEPETIWFAGGKVDLEKGGVTHHIGKGMKDDGSFDERSETEYVTGCSILVKRKMIEDIGFLDENYFLYFEDVDWSLRARRRGWKLICEPAAKLWHKEGAQSEKTYSPRFIYYSLRNRLYLMKRFAPEGMLRCHLIQLRMVLFFSKTSLKKGIAAFIRTLGLAAFSYIDFYVFKKMGRSEIV